MDGLDTNIDWHAYMQEVGGFLAGERNYTLLMGDTGSLVYPAGFVYVFSALFWATEAGERVYDAQMYFMGLYLVMLLLVWKAYARTRVVPLWALLLTVVTSYRIHSIFTLRLFNDPGVWWCDGDGVQAHDASRAKVAMTLLFGSVVCVLNGWWYCALGVFR
jgi:hypothetical protein